MIYHFVMYSDFWSIGDSRPVISASESSRFGRTVSRFNLGFDSKFTDDEIMSICSLDDSDLLVLRAPSIRFELGDHLSRIRTRRIFQADTLLYFSLDVSKYNYQLQYKESEVELRRADFSDESQLRDLINATFEGYLNHYSANIAITSEQMLSGYIEWANSLSADKSHFVYVRKSTDDYLDGFLVIEFQNREIELVIGGTHPSARRTGSYSHLWNFALYDIGQQNVDFIRTSTQVINTNVINSWLKSGFTYSGSINTFHLEKI